MSPRAGHAVQRGIGSFPGPIALARSVAEVSRLHPYTVTGEIDTGASRVASDAEALWDRLINLEENHIDPALKKLSRLDVRLLAATARPRLRVKEARAILSATMQRHDVPNAPALAWEAWLLGDGGEPVFQRVAQPVLAGAGKASECWKRLLGDRRPSEALATVWKAQRGRFDNWAGTPSVALQSYPAFLDLTRRRLLRAGDLADLDSREKSSTIVDWVARVVPSAKHDQWYAAFLTETCRACTDALRWPADHAVCESVLVRAGDPADGKAFWAEVPVDVKAAYSLWLKNRELTDHLGGDNDRVAFWRRYLVPMRRSEVNNDGTVAFLNFGSWVAVQFVNSGRATFMFEETIARGWRRMSDVDVYKKVLGLRSAGSSVFLGSYEHRGFTATWQQTASEIVDDLLYRMKGTPKRRAGG